MADDKKRKDTDVAIAEVPAEASQRPRKTSIPFTYGEAVVYADMLTKLTGQTVDVKQDNHGQWGVVLQTKVVVSKRLTTLNAVHKMMMKLQQSPLPMDEEETPPE